MRGIVVWVIGVSSVLVFAQGSAAQTKSAPAPAKPPAAQAVKPTAELEYRGWFSMTPSRSGPQFASGPGTTLVRDTVLRYRGMSLKELLDLYATDGSHLYLHIGERQRRVVPTPSAVFEDAFRGCYCGEYRLYCDNKHEYLVTGRVVGEVLRVSRIKPLSGAGTEECIGAVSPSAEKTSSGLLSKVVQPGSGSASPTMENRVSFRYVAWSCEGASRTDPRPRMVGQEKLQELPIRELSPELAEALQLMVEGERRRVWPPKTEPVQKGAVAVFEVELLAIAK